MFSSITLTGNYGASASGQLTFTLSQAMANGDSVLLPEPIIAALDGGALSQVLSANTDPDTTPQGVVYGVTEVIFGAQPRDYFIEVPAVVTETNGSTTEGSQLLQLSSLTAALWMTGLPLSGPGIPSDTTVSSVDQQTNQLTLSAAANATETAQSYVIGTTTIDISTLMPTETEWG